MSTQTIARGQPQRHREHGRFLRRHAGEQGQARARARPLRPQDGLRDPRCRPGLPHRLCDRRPPLLHADLVLARGRPSLLARLLGQPDDPHAGPGRAGLPHRHASRCAGDGALGLPPFGQLPGGDGVRHGAHHRRCGEEAHADGPLHRPHLSRALDLDPPAQQAGVQGDDHDGHGDRARLGQDPRQARRRRGGGLCRRPAPGPRSIR